MNKNRPLVPIFVGTTAAPPPSSRRARSAARIVFSAHDLRTAAMVVAHDVAIWGQVWVAMVGGADRSGDRAPRWVRFVRTSMNDVRLVSPTEPAPDALTCAPTKPTFVITGHMDHDIETAELVAETRDHAAVKFLNLRRPRLATWSRFNVHDKDSVCMATTYVVLPGRAAANAKANPKKEPERASTGRPERPFLVSAVGPVPRAEREALANTPFTAEIQAHTLKYAAALFRARHGLTSDTKVWVQGASGLWRSYGTRGANHDAMAARSLGGKVGDHVYFVSHLGIPAACGGWGRQLVEGHGSYVRAESPKHAAIVHLNRRNLGLDTKVWVHGPAGWRTYEALHDRIARAAQAEEPAQEAAPASDQVYFATHVDHPGKATSLAERDLLVANNMATVTCTRSPLLAAQAHLNNYHLAPGTRVWVWGPAGLTCFATTVVELERAEAARPPVAPAGDSLYMVTRFDPSTGSGSAQKDARIHVACTPTAAALAWASAEGEHLQRAPTGPVWVARCAGSPNDLLWRRFELKAVSVATPTADIHGTP